MKLLSLLALATMSWLSAAEEATADSRLLVLSTSGSNRLPEIDASIVSSARTDVRFHVIERTVRIDTAQRDARCSGFDDGCLARIAARRDVDRILYGAITAATDDPERVDLTLRIFDRYTGRTRETTVGSLEADSVDDEREVTQLIEKLVPLVLAVPEEGAAVVRASAGSIIELDGHEVGTVPATGEIELTPLRVGRRVLRISRGAQPSWEAPIVVRARDTIRVTVGAGSAALDDAAGPTRHRTDGLIEPPPEWVLTITGDLPAVELTDPFSVGIGIAQVRFSIPIIEEHVMRGEIRTTTNARVGFLPNVSSSGARVTAKLRF